MAKKSIAVPTSTPVVDVEITESTKTETPAVEEVVVSSPPPAPEPVVVEKPKPDTPVEDKPTTVLKKKKTIVT